LSRLNNDGPHEQHPLADLQLQRGNGGECVQVAAKPSPGRVLVRDSKDPDGPVLAVKLTEWRLFTGHIKH
jgi:Domain of unknown function (DUF397)